VFGHPAHAKTGTKTLKQAARPTLARGLRRENECEHLPNRCGRVGAVADIDDALGTLQVRTYDAQANLRVQSQ
jgi:hypothetical protein